MRSRLLSAILLTAFALVWSAGIAKNPAGIQPPHHSYKNEASGCNAPADQFDMGVNNVRARLLDAGDQWWDLSNGHYEVPKGDITSSTPLPQAIFAGAIWVSALDQGNNLKIAALEYRQGTTDYFTGPLDDNGNVTLSTCNLWDQHFPVFSTDIKPCIIAYQNSGNTNVPGSIVCQSDSNMIRWPGKGNPYLAGEGYTVTSVLAPFYDANGDGIYNPLDGDYPTIKQGGMEPATQPGSTLDSLHYINGFNAYADEMVFWVMNDKGNIHTASNGSPIGIQVNELAFAFQSSDEINNMTFYTYNIINKSLADLHSTYMSQFTDVDLGCANNDRVGCDTSRSMAVQYNGYVGGATAQNGVTCDDVDVCPTSEVGYGCNLPMLGIVYFEGPTDTTMIYDSATHTRNAKKLGMTSFVYYTNGLATAISDPSTAAGYRNYQTGYWNDGTPITYGGNGYGGSIPTPYIFPGDPSISNQWSECNPQRGTPIAAGDRRFVQTSGPFYFRAWASEFITLGVIFVDPPGGVGTNCPSFSFLYSADDKAQALFDNNFAQLQGPSAPLLNLRAMNQGVIITMTDDPYGNNVGESYAQIDPLRVRKGFISGLGWDSLYRFQGYILYQLAGPTVTSSDLSDPTKAIPVAVYDIQDNVSHLVNWDLYTDPITTTAAWVPENGTTIPGVGNNLPNIGIKHTLIDSIDVIGGGQMVNHLTYYFGVISFATNNFKLFVPDSGIGQSTPFLIGKNFNKYEVIPENSTPTDGGRILNSSYGTGTQVHRIEGQGNGGNYIGLTPQTITAILASDSGFANTLDYTINQDPLAFKIVDPMQVKEANFELVIYDTLPYNGVSVSSNAWWVLNDLTNNIQIASVSNLSRPYEQIIIDSAMAAENEAYDLGLSYGFSITLGTPFPVYTNLSDTLPVYGPIGGSITFADATNPWLSFIVDSGQTLASNWIRAGSYEDRCPVPSAATEDPICNVFVDAYYFWQGNDSTPTFTDPNALFGSFAGGTWSPYCIAANWALGPGQAPRTSATASEPVSLGSPAFQWDIYNDVARSPENTLDKLQSVDIVLTSDVSKWSQCVVFETGDNPVLDFNPAPDGSTVPPRRGMLRNQLQRQLPPQTGYISDPTRVGFSWFPGYAVNIETGQRLNVAFGEASDEADQNGRDMIWNPTSTLYGNINQGGYVPYAPIFGGRHYLYVMSTPYDGDSALQYTFTSLIYSAMVNTSRNTPYNSSVTKYLRPAYKSIMWTAMSYLTPGASLLPYSQGLIPNDVTIKLRVQKPYNKFATSATNADSTNIFARYTFSTIGLGPKINNDSVAKSALDMIRIVPNPYLAYSVYENSANTATIKVVNLPNNCSVNIYTLDGVLVRSLSQSINTDPVSNKPIEITNGYDLNSTTGGAALDNSISWDLKNQAAIPVASGIYLFDINVPGVGHKILKWFGAVRPTDVSNF